MKSENDAFRFFNNRPMDLSDILRVQNSGIAYTWIHNNVSMRIRLKTLQSEFQMSHLITSKIVCRIQYQCVQNILK